MFRRGQTQLRGRIRWKVKRLIAMARYGPNELAHMPIIFGNAIPKCGSKLLFNILRSLEQLGSFVDTGLNEIKPFFAGQPTSQDWILSQLDALRPGDIRFGYLYDFPEYVQRLTQERWATFLILRDPRDQIVSEIFYALGMHKGHALNEYLGRLPDMQARIDVIIRGIPEGPLNRVGVFDHYRRFSGWIDHPGLCVIKYEDLVQGREKELDRILSFLESKDVHLAHRKERAIEVMLDAMEPKKSETFRKGVSGGWRDQFSPENIATFKEHTGDLLVWLGYEKDRAW